MVGSGEWPGARAAATAILRSLLVCEGEKPWALAPYVATGMMLVVNSLVALRLCLPSILSLPVLPLAFWILLFWILVFLALPPVASNPKSLTVVAGVVRMALLYKALAMLRAVSREVATTWDFLEITSLACLSFWASMVADWIAS